MQSVCIYSYLSRNLEIIKYREKPFRFLANHYFVWGMVILYGRYWRSALKAQVKELGLE